MLSLPKYISPNLPLPNNFSRVYLLFINKLVEEYIILSLFLLNVYIIFVKFYKIQKIKFIIDLIIFTIFRGIFGPTISAIIAFTFGTFTLFTVLSTFLRGKFKRKRYWDS